MTTAEDALIEGVITVGLSLVAGYVLYSIFTVNRRAVTGRDYGRKWLAWTLLIGTTATLPRFFRHMDLDSIALWAIAACLYGPLAFMVGWFYGTLFGQKQEPITEESALLRTTRQSEQKRTTPTKPQKNTEPSEYDQLAGKVESSVTNTVKKGTAVVGGTFNGLVSALPSSFPRWLRVTLVIFVIYLVIASIATAFIGGNTSSPYTY